LLIALRALRQSLAATMAIAIGCIVVAGVGSLNSSAGAATSGGAGFTVSWAPTTSPVQAIPGQTTHGTFWVTNNDDVAVPVKILPATAIIGNDGKLNVIQQNDPTMGSVTYLPQAFTAQPHSTTAVTTSVQVPKSLAAGIYLLPAVVVPQPSPGANSGNIRIRTVVDALVTLQVPGATSMHLSATFVPSNRSDTPASLHVPGLPTIQLGSTGSEVLRVTDDSKSSGYTFNEITATQSPFGHVVFNGHTAGQPSDIRNETVLIFPGTYRDFPVSWIPSSSGIGVAHLSADAYYHPNPQTVVPVTATSQVLVVSPLWIFLLGAVEGLLLLAAYRRTRQLAGAPDEVALSRGLAARIGQVAVCLVSILIAAFGAFLSNVLVFAIAAALGVLFTLALGIRQAPRALVARRLIICEWIAAAIGVGGIVATALATLTVWSPQTAVALFSGGIVWALMTLGLVWWNQERGPFDPGSTSPDPSNDNEELVTVGTGTPD
jgi:hypothetical protein